MSLSPDIRLLGQLKTNKPAEIFIRFDCYEFEVIASDRKTILGRGWDFFHSAPPVKIIKPEVLAYMVVRTKATDLQNTRIIMTKKLIRSFNKRLDELQFTQKVKLSKRPF